jgi:lysophospholipase L1-like esterase
MPLRRHALALSLLICLVRPAGAAEPAQSSRDAWLREEEARLHNDWPWLGRYQAANAQLPARPKEPRIVFIGDSITEDWYEQAPEFFTAGRIGRGISGQTTPQMLLRFHQDVLDLHPAVVQIIAGANDIASNTGPMTQAQTEANFRMMVELAQAHGIRVIIGAVPPSSRLPWRPGLAVTDKIVALNAWLKSYAAASGAIYADYWSVLQDGQGGFRPDWTSDGAHPNRAGYAAMIPVAQRAIAAALSRPAPQPIASALIP